MLHNVIGNGYTVEVVKLNKGWAQRATVDGKHRYRLYHYKKDAIDGLHEWADYSKSDFVGQLNRNFYSLGETGYKESNE